MLLNCFPSTCFFLCLGTWRLLLCVRNLFTRTFEYDVIAFKPWKTTIQTLSGVLTLTGSLCMLLGDTSATFLKEELGNSSTTLFGSLWAHSDQESQVPFVKSVCRIKKKVELEKKGNANGFIMQALIPEKVWGIPQTFKQMLERPFPTFRSTCFRSVNVWARGGISPVLSEQIWL